MGLYLCESCYKKYGYNLDISNYQWFTDIEFNPQKFINCQAKAVVIYQLIQQVKCYDVIRDKDTWISFHKNLVRGYVIEEGCNGRTTIFNMGICRTITDIFST